MKRSPLRRVSKQKAKDNIQYALAKAEWREKRILADGYPRCQYVWKPGDPVSRFQMDEDCRCWATAMESPHHMKQRHGPLLWNQTYFKALCFTHHDLVERNKTWARKRKYILYK